MQRCFSHNEGIISHTLWLTGAETGAVTVTGASDLEAMTGVAGLSLLRSGCRGSLELMLQCGLRGMLFARDNTLR
jgi:hypothetical protein